MRSSVNDKRKDDPTVMESLTEKSNNEGTGRG